MNELAHFEQFVWWLKNQKIIPSISVNYMIEASSRDWTDLVDDYYKHISEYYK